MMVWSARLTFSKTFSKVNKDRSGQEGLGNRAGGGATRRKVSLEIQRNLFSQTSGEHFKLILSRNYAANQAAGKYQDVDVVHAQTTCRLLLFFERQPRGQQDARIA